MLYHKMPYRLTCMLVLKLIDLVIISNGNIWTLINLLLTLGKASIVKQRTLDLFFAYLGI